MAVIVRPSNTFVATRYHSLVVLVGTVPAEFEVTARTEDGEVGGACSATSSARPSRLRPAWPASAMLNER